MNQLQETFTQFSFDNENTKEYTLETVKYDGGGLADESQQSKKTTRYSEQRPYQQQQQQKSIKIISFDDAIALTKFGKFNYFLIMVSATILTAVLTETLSISFILPASQCDLNLTSREKGILGAIGFAGIITSSYLWGFLSDTIGRRKILLPTLLLAFICSVLSSLTNDFTIFIILRFLNGFFMACPSSTIFAYLGEFHNTKNRSKIIMWASSIYGISGIIGPIVAYYIINLKWQFDIPIINVTYKPWRSFIVLSSIPSLACAISFLFLPESPKYLLSIGEEKEAIRILEKIRRINLGSKVEPLNIESLVDDMDAEYKKNIKNKNDDGERSNINNNKTNNNKINKDPLALIKLMWRQTLPLFLNPYLKRTIILCTLQIFINIISNGFYIWLPEIINRIAEYMNANENHNLSICQIMHNRVMNESIIMSSIITSQQMIVAVDPQVIYNETLKCSVDLEPETIKYTIFLEISYAVGFTLLGCLINPIGKIPLLFIISVGCGACGIILAYLNVPLIGIYLSIMFCSCGLGVMVVNAIVVDLFPTNIRGMAVCMSILTGRLGGVIGSNMVGSFLDYHCETLFSVSGVFLIGCGILAFFVPKIKTNKQIENKINDIVNDQKLDL